MKITAETFVELCNNWTENQPTIMADLLECVAKQDGEKLNDWKLRTTFKPRQMIGHEQTQELCQLVNVTTHTQRDTHKQT